MATTQGFAAPGSWVQPPAEAAQQAVAKRPTRTWLAAPGATAPNPQPGFLACPSAELQPAPGLQTQLLAVVAAFGSVGLLSRSAQQGARVRRRLRLISRRSASPKARTWLAAAATEPEIPDDAEGSACSIWMEKQEPTIDEALVNSDWGSLMDKVESINGDTVRACRKGAKQVATLGPASWSEVMLERLFLCGVDVFRLNFSHGEHSEKAELVDRIRDLEMKYKHPICILADMQGPKQRCGKFAEESGVELRNGQGFRFDLDPALGDEHRVQLPHPEILIALTPGKTLLLDDGKLRMRVERSGCVWQGKEIFVNDPKERPSSSEKECPPFIDCIVEVGGKLSARKGVNTPDVVLPISPITPKDMEDIEFACQNDADWIAMSFVQRHEDMLELRQRIAEVGCARPKIMAKIEKPSAVTDLEKILEASDGVMVARGDLGVEMNPEEVPIVQKDIIAMARRAGKPVIVATQMLESMISSPAPTRAECSDVANAILDGCDGVMLSGETAMGKFPLECVQMQRRVIEASERQQAKQALQATTQGTLPPVLRDLQVSEDNAVLASAVTLAQGVNAKAIICFTALGTSVQQLVKLHPSVPILAVSACLETARWLTLLRGVYATSDTKAQALAARVNNMGPYSVRFTEGLEVACEIARQKGIALEEGDSLVVISRLPLFSQGVLNCIRVTSAMGPHAADGYGPAADLQDDD